MYTLHAWPSPLHYVLIYVQLWHVHVCFEHQLEAEQGTWFPLAVPAGAPVLNKVNWLIGSEQVKAQPVVITLCMCVFFWSVSILDMRVQRWVSFKPFGW